jgi:hypothetical protein
LIFINYHQRPATTTGHGFCRGWTMFTSFIESEH